MKKLWLFLLPFLGILWLNGCNTAPATAPPPSPAAATPVPPTLTPVPSPTFTPSPTNTPTATPDPRFATVEDAVNDVTARARPDDAPAPATQGLKIYTGGDVQTGDESRASLLLTPEDTIIRVGANTHFVLQARTPDEGKTTLQMLLGKLWIILKGGSLDVETPSGTASVRGSLMSVSYTADGALQVTCLEGHCGVQSTTGEHVDLTNGEAITIPGVGEPPSDIFPIPEEELEEWLEMAGEAAEPYIPTATYAPSPTPLPITYHLVNNCDEVWHWRFSGPHPVSLDIAPHSAATGTLVGGTYTAVDWIGDNGEKHSTGPIYPGGYITATSCQ